MQGKKLLLFSGIIFLFTFMVIGYLIFQNSREKNSPDDITTIPTPVPLIYKSPVIENVAPPVTQTLIPGTFFTAEITFSQPVSSNQIKVFLTSRAIGNTSAQAENIPVSMSFPSSGILKVTSSSPVQVSREYSLVILDSNNTSVLSISYLSGSVEITREPANNQELKKFLPYETDTYILTYNERRNMYIFNFKINPDSNDSLQSQFDAAKKEAEDFIKSKGIDINSIVIEWRHS